MQMRRLKIGYVSAKLRIKKAPQFEKLCAGGETRTLTPRGTRS